MRDKRGNIKLFILSLGLVLISYIPTFRWMVDRWLAPESYYGHGFLIPFVSGYVLWQRRELLKRTELSSDWLGLILVVSGLLVHLGCALFRVYFLSGFSFIFVLFGLILYFLGRRIAKSVLFPVFFLVAMVPLPLVLIGNLTVKLKLFAAEWSTVILNKIGFPSIREGSIIRMPNSYIAVEAPCSGLRSLIALLTLGLLFAYAAKNSFLKKGLLFISAVPIALAGNMLRIIMLATVNDLYGEEVAMGFFHDFLGFFVFAFAFAGLWGVSRVLERER